MNEIVECAGQPDASDPSAAQPTETTPHPVIPPTITMSAVTFSDGTRFELGPDEVVVFVGPNNAGKSRALNEISRGLETGFQGQVIRAFHLRRTGTVGDLEAYLRAHSKVEDNISYINYRGQGYAFNSQNLPSLFEHALHGLSSFFCSSLTTENRLIGGNPANAIDFYSDVPSHPIHTLFRDDDVAERIGRYFRRGFDKDLFPFHGGGGSFRLLVGDRPARASGEDRVSSSYVTKTLAQARALEEQGDGMRAFATVILSLLVTRTQSMLLLDEPEAFLHPPQARLLGEFIAKERPSGSQLFVSTHSPDILRGLIGAAPGKVRIVRLVRDGDLNRVKELSKDKVLRIANDPLMQYSGVLDAVFHERAFIAEADTDCMFYNSILSLPSIHGTRQPDAVFIHAGGKHRMHVLADALRDLGVKTDVIVDIDILRNDDDFRRLGLAVGVEWAAIASDARGLRQAIDARKGGLSAHETVVEIQKLLATVPPEGSFPETQRKAIDRVLKQTSPWTVVKDGGKAALPPGQATQQFNRIDAACGAAGLWVVPVGEVEGFCKSIGGHGPQWVQKVLETKDLASDPDLQSAREFVSKMWGRA